MSRNSTTTWKATPFRIRLALAWTSLALLLPLAATGCSHKEANAEEGKHQAEAAVEVETINPVRQDLTRDVEQPGVLKPWETTPIYTKIAGFALDWKYDLGDRVKKDTELVKLYVPEVEEDLRVKWARVEQAVADVKQSRAFAKAAAAAVEAAKAEVEAKAASIRSVDADVKRWDAEVVRSVKLFAQGTYDKATLDEVRRQYESSVAFKDEVTAKWFSSKARLVQADANFNKAEADVEVAEASERVARAAHAQWKAWLDYREIKAPYDGLITLRNVAKGDFLQPSNSGSTSKAAEPLYIMMNTYKMRCTIEVPEMDAVLIKDGDPAEVRFQARPGAPTIGYVKRNSGALDDHSRTLRVEVHLDNPDNTYLPNMYMKITIRAKMPKTWSLPATVVMKDIMNDKDRPYCFMLEDGKDGKKIARKTFLEVGEVCEGGLLPIYRKQRSGSNVWEDFTGKEAVVATNAQALLDEQVITLKARAPQ